MPPRILAIATALVLSTGLQPVPGTPNPSEGASQPVPGPGTSKAGDGGSQPVPEPGAPKPGEGAPQPLPEPGTPKTPTSTIQPPSREPAPAAGGGPTAGGSGRMRGEVSFNRQEPAVGAMVVLMREGDPGRLLLGVTDTHGYFRFESIPEGTWTVGIVQDGAMPDVKRGIVVKPPGRAVVDILLKKSTGRVDPPVFDLARFEKSGQASAASPSLEDGTPAGTGAGAGAGMGVEKAEAEGLVVEVLDSVMKAIREARLTLRSRGPLVDPLRGTTDGEGTARFGTPAPGEYLFKVDVPGYLPARIDRLVLGHTAPFITAVMTSRPLDYPARPAELLPEERSVPPPGFPGAPTANGVEETKPSQKP